MWITVIPIINLYCFPNRTSRRCISYSQSKYPRSQHHICSLHLIAAMFLMSQNDSQVSWYILLIVAYACSHSSSLKLNTLVIYYHSHCRTRITSRNIPPAKAATEWFPKQYWNHYDLHHLRQQHNLQCTMFQHHTTPNAIDKSGWLLSQFNFFSSEPYCDCIKWIHHCIQPHFPPWSWFWSRSLQLRPSGRIIFLLLLQYTNITPHQHHQSIKSHRCSLLPPQPPQVTVLPAPLPPEPF